MPTGTNDFNAPLPTDPTSQGQGISQISRQILMGGGANSQSGRWLWASGFESGLNEWELSTASGRISLAEDWVYQGVYSCKISTQAVAGSEERIEKVLFSQGGGRYGFESVFSNTLNTALQREISWRIEGGNQDPSQRSRGLIVLKINAVNDGDLYIDVNGSRTLISSVDEYIINASSFFNYIKLVFDPKTNSFIRLYFGEKIFDLGGAPGYLFSSTDRNINFRIYAKTLLNQISDTYIDNVIITADEP
jgi:hypothetical protein